MDESPSARGYAMPAEWSPHRAVWMAFPYLDDEWRGRVHEAQVEHAALASAIATHGGERVELLVANTDVRHRAESLLGDVPGIRLHTVPYGDAWTRDTAPIGVVDARGARAALRFRFNGWGEKFAMPGDDSVGDHILARWGVPAYRDARVLEGGSIDVDGRGTLLTTESCLFEPHRNPGLDRAATIAWLGATFGARKVLFLGEGLVNDHTDGHVDTLARFVPGGRVVAMEPRSADDPHRDALLALLDALAGMTDADGKPLELVRLPSPGRLLDHEGEILPASYCNFYIANEAVFVPTYGAPTDAEAVATLGRCFPDRRVLGLSSEVLITGGGSFHCMTQQEPEGSP